MKVLSRDSVTVTVDAVIYYRVSNPTMVHHIIIIIIFTTQSQMSHPTMVFITNIFSLHLYKVTVTIILMMALFTAHHHHDSD